MNTVMLASSESLTIRAASADEIDEVVAVDDDAYSLFASIGLAMDFEPGHPFVASEYARWTDAVRGGNVFFACASSGRPVGVLIMNRVDGKPFIEQLSVRVSAMRRGVGRRLLAKAYAWSGEEDLWLVTYRHVPWNRPYYERAGFSCVTPAQCPPGVAAILDEHRRWLLAPEEWVAMVRRAR